VSPKKLTTHFIKLSKNDMSKKYYIKDGVKIYIDDKDLKDAEAGAGDPPTPPTEPPKTDDDEEVDAAATKIAKEIVGKIGLDKVEDMNKRIDQLFKMSQPNDSKLTQILNGKDYIKDVDKLTKEEKIIGFYHALVTNNEHALKALSETAADGGNLIPQDFMAELNRDLADLVVMRQIARIVPMRRNTMVIPRATTQVKTYWTAENASKTTTTATFTQDTLTAFKCAAILYASDELIEDSTAMGSFDIVRLIITMFAESIAMIEEDAFGAGNGTTAPLGIETARAANTFASIASVGQNFDDIIRLEYALKAQYRKNAAFIAHDQAVRNMRLLKDSQNRYLWQEPLAPNQPATFHGYPVYTMNSIPHTVIYFGDWKRGYWIGDRKQMTVKVTQDSETAFTKDQTAIRVVERVGAQVVLPAALKALTGF
jgi:HK97 family phage major capsid protein